MILLHSRYTNIDEKNNNIRYEHISHHQLQKLLDKPTGSIYMDCCHQTQLLFYKENILSYKYNRCNVALSEAK